MLKIITDITDPLLDYIRDDPVRPEITREFRVSQHRFVVALIDQDPRAIVCVGLKNFIPKSVSDLDGDCDNPTTAVFYTIWSYASGSASELLFSTVHAIQQQWPPIEKFVTLSPKTEMAHKFHTRNGARILQENDNTVNYKYIVEI